MRTTLSAVLRRASPFARIGLAAGAGLSFAGRVGAIGTAVAIGHEMPRVATAVGGLTVACMLAHRFVQTVTRVRLERDVYRGVVDGLLESDVLDVSRERTQRVVFEGVFHAVTLAGLASVLLGDLLAMAVVAPVLATSFKARALATAAVATSLVGAALLVTRRWASRSEQRLMAAHDAVADVVLTAVEGRLEIVARGGEADFVRRFAKIADAYVRRADRAGIVMALLGRAPFMVGIAAVAVIVAVDPTSRSEISTEVIKQAVLLAACLPPVLGVVLGVHSVARRSVAVGPLIEVLEAAPRQERGTAEVPPLPAPFELVGVSFRYGDGQPWVLRDMTLTWTGSDVLVLVGENGSGKTTLLKLLLGLRWPTAGEIRLGSRRLQDVDVRALRRSTAYLPQRPYLGEAHSTVRAAVHLTVPGADDRSIRKALDRVGVLGALLARGADPLDVTIGELSVGQRQRVALARLLVHDAAIVLLDEPDANLDREGGALVAALVRELSSQGKMVAVAAHTPELAALSSRPVLLTPSRAAAE